jgi:F0F1-type ATP synthase membrane subunit c/vacuolar-type H+-ATPase subunit K
MKPTFSQQLMLLGIGLVVAVATLIAGCGDSRSNAHAVYMLVDTSGTYAQESNKAQLIVNYLLGTLQPGDSLAVARVESRSFSEKDIIAKATFDARPSQANAQKRAFKDNVDSFLRSVKGSRYTDITGGLLQGAEYLNETGAGTKTIIVFSDMQEELDKVTQRAFPISLNHIRVVAVNVVKLKTDNVDPRLYLGRLESWQKRVQAAGASEWRVINDLERLDTVLAKR